jgi:hypothetical protein
MLWRSYGCRLRARTSSRLLIFRACAYARRTEHGHHPVAGELVHHAAVALYDCGAMVTEVSTGNARRYVDPLTDAGIIIEFTDRTRNRAWRAPEVLSARRRHVGDQAEQLAAYIKLPMQSRFSRCQYGCGTCAMHLAKTVREGQLPQLRG